MNTDDMTDIPQKKSKFTPKKLFRILSLICIVMVFCPMFLVSCSGETLEIDVMTAVGGLSMYEETLVEPQPIMLLCLIIPIAVLIMFLKKNIELRKSVIWTLISMIVDFIIWIVFRSTVKKYADEYLCTFEATGWFYINLISMSLIVLLAVLVFLKIIDIDTDLIRLLSGDVTKEMMNQASESMNKMAGSINKMVVNVVVNGENKETETDRNSFCVRCGASVSKESKFCTSCGLEIPKKNQEDVGINQSEKADSLI